MVDTRDAATRKRVNQAIDDQWQQIQARALVAHEPGCDPFTCSKSVCFKYVGDKIVSAPKVVNINKERYERAKEHGNPLDKNQYYQDDKKTSRFDYWEETK